MTAYTAETSQTAEKMIAKSSNKLKPVNESLSLLTAWCRLVYTVIAIVAFLNLVTVVRLLNSFNSSTGFDPGQFPTQVMSSLDTFRSNWYFGLLFFGIHLGLLGYLVFRSNYIPRLPGVLLAVAGFGYLINSPKSGTMTWSAAVTWLVWLPMLVYEVVLVLWLLIKGVAMPVGRSVASP